MARETVVITIGIPGEGQTTHEIGPGETFAEVTDGAAYIEVEAPEPSEGLEVEFVSTEEQDDVASQTDREMDVAQTTCTRCGDVYPKSYSRCQQCGMPNQNG